MFCRRKAIREAQRRALLSGRDIDVPETGAIVCSCFQVGERQIAAAVRQGSTTVEALWGATALWHQLRFLYSELRELIGSSVPEGVE
ncbi:MAG: (2Fe-2S)-binding protein [Marinobacter sp.]|nr:(2Fe-2S)-binding protein [Marinobacter sp.]